MDVRDLVGDEVIAISPSQTFREAATAALWAVTEPKGAG